MQQFVEQFEPQEQAINEPSLMNRMLGNRAMHIVAGVASVGAFMLAGSRDSQPIVGGPAIAEAVTCDPSNPNVNTITCTPPLKELLRDCPDAATYPTLNGQGSTRLTGTYDSQNLNIRVRGRIGEMGKACDRVMVRKWKVFQLLDTGENGSFIRNGSSYTYKGNRKKTISTQLKAPIDCDDPSNSNRLMELQVTSTAMPKNHYKLKGKKTSTWHTEPQPAC